MSENIKPKEPSRSDDILGNAVAMRRISKAEPGCYIVDLKMLLLSLEFPELDGVPVLQEVVKVGSVSVQATASVVPRRARVHTPCRRGG
jgi:hypothetical protein